MYDFSHLLQKEPVAIAAAIVAIVNLIQVFGFISLSADQLASLNTALVLILGLIARQASVPAVVAAANEAEAFAAGLATPTPEE